MFAARLARGETALVIGGGSIGMLIAMVAETVGAEVTLSEVNRHRLSMASALGMNVLNPRECDVAKTLLEATGGKGVDVVFEVSGV